MPLLTRMEVNTHLAEAAGLATDRLPQNNAEADIAQEALERALNNLSFNEHEKIVFDLHGIATEQPVCEMSKLKELEKELSLIQEKPAYERAKQMNPSFVQNNSFRLMFLRGEKFNAKHAAELMVHHFQIKQELFGNGEILARDVRLRDLRQCDLECLRSGFVQICPSRDAAGRTVLLSVPVLKTCNDMQIVNRVAWYTLMCALKNEETQKKGVVALLCNFRNRIEKMSTLRQFRRVRISIPLWISGMHYCYNNAALRPAVTGMQLFLPDAGRFRFRSHFGDLKDIIPKLQAYGIPFDEKYPMECTGRWSVQWHHEWLNMQEASEAKSVPFSVDAPVVDNVDDDDDTPGIVPGRFDVLFGKGKKARIHTGTVRCSYLVEMNRERYEKAKRHEKTTVADHIIAMIHESHGRFLKWERKTGWMEVEHKVAREKVSHFFRQLRGKTNNTKVAQKDNETAFLLD